MGLAAEHLRELHRVGMNPLRKNALLRGEKQVMGSGGQGNEIFLKIQEKSMEDFQLGGNMTYIFNKNLLFTV